MVLFSRRLAAPKPHVVVLGKWTSVKWQAGDDEGKPVDVKIRPLYVDGRTKEFTLGPTHDVTDRAFVVQRMFRLNDSLPQDAGPAGGVGNGAGGCWPIASPARCSRLRCRSLIPTIRQ